MLSSMFLASVLLAKGPLNSPKISPWLKAQYPKRHSSDGNPTVLIYLKTEANLQEIPPDLSRNEKIQRVFKKLTETAAVSQKPILDWLKSKKIEARSYYIANLIVAEKVPESVLETLAQRDDVSKVVGNPPLRNQIPKTNRDSAQESKGPGENLIRLGATRVWEELKIRGENIVVAGQDTGVRWDHAALKNHYRGWNGTSADHSYSWHDAVHKTVGGNSSCGYNLSVPCDDHNHGTHTMGTIIGDDGQGNQIGVAPGAKWIACRNMDSGMGTPQQYIECFQWFLAPWPQNGDPIKDAKPDMAPHVINNSWGCPLKEGCEGNEFERVLKALKSAGILVVASAGNDGSSCATINNGPAYHSDLVLSVGAIDHRDDSIAYFSSRGPSVFDKKVGPQVTAPGVDVRSAVKSGGYAEYGWSGTSMAGPHLVGLVALLWSADKSLIGKIDETLDIINDKAEAKTSDQTCGGTPGTARPNNTYGYGIANAFEVVKSRLSNYDELSIIMP
jgi:serine protease AprX